MQGETKLERNSNLSNSKHQKHLEELGLDIKSLPQMGIPTPPDIEIVYQFLENALEQIEMNSSSLAWNTSTGEPPTLVQLQKDYKWLGEILLSSNRPGNNPLNDFEWAKKNRLQKVLVETLKASPALASKAIKLPYFRNKLPPGQLIFLIASLRPQRFFLSRKESNYGAFMGFIFALLYMLAAISLSGLLIYLTIHFIPLSPIPTILSIPLIGKMGLPHALIAAMFFSAVSLLINLVRHAITKNSFTNCSFLLKYFISFVKDTAAISIFFLAEFLFSLVGTPFVIASSIIIVIGRFIPFIMDTISWGKRVGPLPLFSWKFLKIVLIGIPCPKPTIAEIVGNYEHKNISSPSAITTPDQAGVLTSSSVLANKEVIEMPESRKDDSAGWDGVGEGAYTKLNSEEDSEQFTAQPFEF